jgi:hypothetical protein
MPTQFPHVRTLVVAALLLGGCAESTGSAPTGTGGSDAGAAAGMAGTGG